jgi:vacuolar-type H+-ATPase subunit I/STV1
MLSQLLSSAAPALGTLGYIILAIGTIFLVMALEGLVSFTHVLRLTWVEFGFKYFRGGGREYKPLGVH